MPHSPTSYFVALALVLALAGCADVGVIGIRSDGGRDAPIARVVSDPCGNGIDDDGDGRIDDGCPCGPGETQSCFGGARASAGVGACASGRQTCIPGLEWGDWGDAPCVGSVLPSVEQCDGLDHDCDGARDEDCPCIAGEERACATDFAVGECRGGVQRCGPASVWGGCSDATHPRTEICDDGRDQDCDGIADEGCGCVPAPEVCRDGIDNDCDGAIDEPACDPDWRGATCAPGDLLCATPEASSTPTPMAWTSVRTRSIEYDYPFRAASAGAEVAVAFHVDRMGVDIDNAIHLVRFSRDGAFLGATRPLRDVFPGLAADQLGVGVVSSLVWTGTGYAVLWDGGRAVDPHARIARITPDGTRASAPIEIAPGTDAVQAIATVVSGRLLVVWQREGAFRFEGRELDLGTFAPLGEPFALVSGGRGEPTSIDAVGDVAAFAFLHVVPGPGPSIAFVRSGALLHEIALDTSPVDIASGGAVLAASGCHFLACWRVLLEDPSTVPETMRDRIASVDRCQLFDADGIALGGVIEPAGNRGGHTDAVAPAMSIAGVPGGFVLQVTDTRPVGGTAGWQTYFATIAIDGTVASVVELAGIGAGAPERGALVSVEGGTLALSAYKAGEITDALGTVETFGISTRRAPGATCP